MRQGVALFVAAGLVAATLPFIRQHDDALLGLLGKAKIAVTGDEQPAPHKTLDPPALAGIELQYMDDRREVVTAPAHGKRNAELTVDPIYQRAALSFLRQGRVYEGAVVMTDVRTGRALVWASYNQGRPRDVASEAKLPSASVFKVVTGAALIEAGVPLNHKVCYSGGLRRITERELEADERRDKYCASLGMAMGRSINTIFARLAVERLDPEKLTGAAKRLGWGLDIPFDVPIEQSTVDIPVNDRLEFARAAAGFWHTTLSPFQGANLAQTIANGGEMIRTSVVERVVDEDEEVLYQRPKQRQVFKRVLDERTAWAVARMMEQTVRNGSAFKAFHDRAGRPFLPDIAVAAKTGTLAKKEHGGKTLITWWVGFAPADKPEVALSVLVTNRGPWRVKGMHVAADMLRVYFADQGAKGVRHPPSFKGPKRRKKPKAPAETDKPSDDKSKAKSS
ncbi:MAG: penicillin-binding protein [Deltaproteobacteria bacterium]|nr:penicillin-binding protein [Deltaproteobacteria bacterium]